MQIALEKAEYINKALGYELKLEIDYKNAEQLKYELLQNKIKILKTEYKQNVELMIEVPEEKLYLLEDQSKNCKLNVIKLEKIAKKYVEI